MKTRPPGGRLPDALFRLSGPLIWLGAGLVLVAMIVPILVVFPISLSGTRYMTFPPSSYSLRWYESYFSVPEWTRATLYSAQIGVLSTALALVLGIPAALGLNKAGFRGRGAITALFVAPLVLPLIIMAIALYFALARVGLTGTSAGLVISHAMLALPFVVVVVLASLAQYDERLSRAAASLGAPPFVAFRTVTLPLIRPGVLSAALLSFLASFNEFIVALFMVSTDRVTLPIQFWKGLRFETNPTIAAVASMLIVLTVLSLGLAEFIRSRGAARTARHRNRRQED
jgi:ABC-type spermidine/putrescine transport system permease subunit II